MKMMQRIVALSLAAVISLFCMTGCSGTVNVDITATGSQSYVASKSGMSSARVSSTLNAASSLLLQYTVKAFNGSMSETAAGNAYASALLSYSSRARAEGYSVTDIKYIVGAGTTRDAAIADAAKSGYKLNYARYYGAAEQTVYYRGQYIHVVAIAYVL